MVDETNGDQWPILHIKVCSEETGAGKERKGHSKYYVTTRGQCVFDKVVSKAHLTGPCTITPEKSVHYLQS